MTPRPCALGALAVLLCASSAALAALLEVLLVPLYVGSTLVPITIGLALASNVVLPWLARRAVPSSAAAALPVLIWGLSVIVLSQSPSGGDVLLPGGGGVGVVSYAVLGVGTLAGVVTVGVLATRATRASTGERRAVGLGQGGLDGGDGRGR